MVIVVHGPTRRQQLLQPWRVRVQALVTWNPWLMIYSNFQKKKKKTKKKSKRKP